MRDILKMAGIKLLLMFTLTVKLTLQTENYRNIAKFELLPNQQIEIINGKTRYELLRNQIPLYGECWINAVEDLHLGCKHLNEETQSRLAFTFARCFLLKIGMKINPCPSDVEIAECMKNIDERTFSSYTEFFTHTQSICFFLQNQVWQNEVEGTVSKLSVTSKQLGYKLEQASEKQAEILKLQSISLNGQKRLLKSGNDLNFQIEKSRENIKSIFQELRSTTQEHRILIFEVFEQINKLNALILGGFVGFYTFVFYMVSIFVSYLLTSTARTQDARLWLFIIMTLNCILEQVISSYSIKEETERNKLLENEGPICYRIWLCRKITSVTGIFIVIFFAYHYKNYNEINNRLLSEIHKQNLELKNQINNMGFNNKKENGIVNHIQNMDFSSDSYRSSDDELFHYASSEEETSDIFPLNYSVTSRNNSDYFPQHAENISNNSSILSFDSKTSYGYSETESSVSKYNLRSRKNGSLM